ncbi:uncharacterized protein LOC127803750 [Diospyros lotus]|uniref:uncharacterized protein LOC127803750 n=1 Tax=Diospyros lotus TaxID=55363 RepID=UPI0022562B8E|nr:uncharacterized protein LOC127803750 [Diospyros lotus]XP_052196168.1 uncharacterized protein LOC127803750 [Diospyros lotus]XP_052196178.1 uncharacterized protein LOC127803750 [Diospyros lotus]
MGAQQNDKSTERSDSSVSGSEKSGVDVSWQRFPDEIKHVPIKKRRRFMLQSPSPMMSETAPLQPEQSPSSKQQTSSSQFDDSNQTNNRESGSGQLTHLDSVTNQELGATNGPVEVQFHKGIENTLVTGELSEVINRKPGYIEDFSGISLLAAAACNNNINDDSQGNEGEFLRPENINCSISATPLTTSTTSSDTSNLSLKDSECEDNIDYSNVQGNLATASLNFHGKRDSETEKKSASMKDERLHWDLNTVMEAWKTPCDDGLDSENPEKSQGCVRHWESDQTLSLLTYSSADTEVSTPLISKNRSLDNLHCPESDCISSSFFPAEKTNTYPTNAVIQAREDCDGTSSLPLIKMLSAGDVPCSKHNVVHLDQAGLEKVMSQIDSIELKKDCREAFDLPNNGTPSTDLVSRVNNGECSVCKPGKLDPSHPSPHCKAELEFGKNFERGQDNEAPLLHASTNESSLHVHNKPKSFECFGRVSFEGHNDNGCVADVSVGFHGHMGVEKLSGSEAGNSREAFDLPDNGTSLTGLVSRVNNCEHSVRKSGKLHSPNPSPDLEKLHISGNTSEEGQDKEASALHSTPNGSLFHVDESKPKCYELFGKVGCEDHSDPEYGVYGSPGIHGQMVNVENIPQSDAGYSRDECDLPDNGSSLIDLMSRVTNVERSVCMLEKPHPSQPSLDHENAHVFGNTIEDGPDREGPALLATLNESHVAMNVHKSYERFGKAAFEDHDNHEYGADISQGFHGHVVGIEKLSGSKTGYESPFEDGELSQSVVYSLEGNEVEGESECVDYDSDIRDEDDLDASTHCLSNVGSDGSKNENNGSLAENIIQYGGLDASNQSNQSTGSKELSVQDQAPDACRFSCNTTMDSTDKQLLACDSYHGLDAKGSSAVEVGSRGTRGKLSSRVEGSSLPDALDVKEKSRSNSGSCFQAKKVFDSAKYLRKERPARRIQDASQGDGPRIDSPAGLESRNSYETGYAHGTGRFRPTSVGAKSMARMDGLSYRDQKQSMYYSSKGNYQHLLRRISDCNDAYSVHRGMVAERDNHDTRRSRSGIYREGVNRGPREQYRGALPEDPASSSVGRPRYLSRRDRSFSPIIGGGASVPRSRWRSRSRSRTRSPVNWRLQRERNMGVRGLDRTPDLRSEFKMERTRMLSQKSDFPADEDIFLSPSRNGFFPRNSTQWIDNQNYMAAPFKPKKPPGRMFWRNPRFDSRGSSGRMKSDDCRSMIGSRRFTDLPGGAGRGHKYDAGRHCEGMEEGGRYEMIRGARHYDTGGGVRRFHYDEDDYFELRNCQIEEDSCIRGSDRRDMPMTRSGREERGAFRYNNERKYATPAGPGSKLSRIRDYEDCFP